MLPLAGPVLQRGRAGSMQENEVLSMPGSLSILVVSLELPLALLQAWAGRVGRTPSPHQEGVYLINGRIFSCEEAALEVLMYVCLCVNKFKLDLRYNCVKLQVLSSSRSLVGQYI